MFYRPYNSMIAHKFLGLPFPLSLGLVCGPLSSNEVPGRGGGSNQNHSTPRGFALKLHTIKVQAHYMQKHTMQIVICIYIIQYARVLCASHTF